MDRTDTSERPSEGVKNRSHSGDSAGIGQHQGMTTSPTTKTTKTLTAMTGMSRTTPANTDNNITCTVDRTGPDAEPVCPHDMEHDVINTTNTTTSTSTEVESPTNVDPKSTTCAFSRNPSPGTTLRHNQNPPLDDTMAQAVETLQIGPTNVVMPEPTSNTAPCWTLVPAAYKKAPTGPTTSHTSQEFGLAFERTTKGNNWSTDDLLLILQTIQSHDPQAMLSSADNKTKPTLVTAVLHKAQKDTPWFTKFTAMKTMTWGKPSDGTTKIVFSLWLTSTIIKKQDLAQLRMDSDFTEMLKGTNTYMKVTKLLEPPHSKIVGYFLGKDIIHTNTSKAQIMSKYTSVMYLH